VDNDLLSKSPIGQIVPVQGDYGLHDKFACWAFLAAPLPEDIEGLTSQTWALISAASTALGRLDQETKGLEDPQLLIYPTLFREALTTSALEGTYGQLSDLLETRLSGNQIESQEIREIYAYLEAARGAFKSVETRSISVAMLCDVQREILAQTKKPFRDVGEVRKHHVWIGDEGQPIGEARFVPAPGDDRLKAGLEELVDWIGRESVLPPVLRAAMAHYQFETLHPFGDGNGRVGRLIVILQLLRSKSIAEPVITVSPWFNERKQQYKDQLLALSCTGDWNPWVAFFCNAIIDQSQALIEGAEHIDNWLKESTKTIHQRRWTGIIHDVLKDLASWPKLTVTSTAEKYEITQVSATSIVNHLCDIGILTETTGRSYGRVFVAQEIMDIVEAI